MLSQPPLWLIIIAFIAAIGPLIIIHELGHYWVARIFGVGAEQFSIGFGKEIGGWTDKRGTRWRVSLLPLGGYVKFVGDTDPTSLGERIESIEERPGNYSFHSRPPWQRFFIILAGPLANFLLAIAIYAALFGSVGLPRTSSEVTAIQEGGPAELAGIEIGDRILTIAGRNASTFEDIVLQVKIRPGERVEVVADRDGVEKSFDVTLATAIEQDRFGQQFKIGRLGVIGSKAEYVDIPPSEWLVAGTSHVYRMTRAIIDGLGQIITGRRSIKEIGGPLRMAQIAGQQASLSLIDFIQLIAFFSINLGFINLLPVPVLDGGHLVLTTLEAIRRKPVSPRVMEWAFRGGLAFLLLLMLVATFNDLGAFGLWEGVGRLIG